VKCLLFVRGDIPLLDVPFSNLSTVWADAARRFNASSPTKVIVHGFGSSCSHVWVYEMRSALMAVEDCNVICVDWERGATIPNYVRAAANTRMVGKQVALLLAGLQRHAGLPVHKVHVIGFSLGAHVAGFAGAELKNLSRITGTQPEHRTRGRHIKSGRSN
jgi:predicted alpha/beta-fold hydrolase